MDILPKNIWGHFYITKTSSKFFMDCVPVFSFTGLQRLMPNSINCWRKLNIAHILCVNSSPLHSRIYQYHLIPRILHHYFWIAFMTVSQIWTWLQIRNIRWYWLITQDLKWAKSKCNEVDMPIVLIYIFNKYFAPYLLLPFNIICVIWNMKISLLYSPWIPCKIMSLFNKILSLFHSHLAQMYPDYPSKPDMVPH